MPKFNILENKSVTVGGSLVFLEKGELETEDAGLIKALSSAVGVELITKKPTAAELKAQKAAEEAAELAAKEAAEKEAAEKAEAERLAALASQTE